MPPADCAALGRIAARFLASGNPANRASRPRGPQVSIRHVIGFVSPTLGGRSSAVLAPTTLGDAAAPARETGLAGSSSSGRAAAWWKARAFAVPEPVLMSAHAVYLPAVQPAHGPGARESYPQ